MNKSPAYRWYPKDILGSARVSMMTAQEECWYRRALDFSWLHGGIPSDPVKLARMIGKECTKGGARVVLQMFDNSDDPGRKVNERQEVEREKQRIWSEKSAIGGKASGGKSKKINDQIEQQGGSTTLGSKSTAKGQPKGNIPFAVSSSYEEDVKNTHIDADAISWKYPVKELAEAFPNMTITPAMIGFLESEVTPADRDAWIATIKVYTMNYDPAKKRYLPDKTANVLGVFQNEKAKLEKVKNGTSKGNNYGHKRTDQEVFAESADFYANYPES